MTFPLVKKLKDPIQQKVLVGAALLLLLSRRCSRSQ